MSISDNDTQIKHFFKAGFVYLLISVFCAFFGAVYEHFSHEVYSYYMIYAFALPLVFGTFPMYAFGFMKPKKVPNAAALNLYNAGVATLTVGSIFKGVLDIYGTTNDIVNVYWYIGGLLLGIGLLLYLFSLVGLKH